MVTKAFFLQFILITTLCFAQSKTDSTKTNNKINKVVDVACGQCQFALKTKKGCDLAIRDKNQAFFVKGTSIDQHGDAHAKDGFCNAIKKARVKGKLINDIFYVTEFKLLPN